MRLALAHAEKIGDRAIFISSNVLERPDYRRTVFDLCEREGLCPLIVERQSLKLEEAIRQSMQKIEQASIYLGLFSHLEGPWPKEHDLLRIEAECEQAHLRGLPCLVFIGRDERERPLAAAELKAIQRWLPAVSKNVCVEFFSNAHDLRASLGRALEDLRTRPVGLPVKLEQPKTAPADPRAALNEPLQKLDWLIEQERYDEAYDLFDRSLYEPMCVRWSLCEEAAGYLQRLFPQGFEAPPKLSSPAQRLSALWTLAYCFRYSGRPSRAAVIWQDILDPLHFPSLDLCSRIRAWHNLSESRVDDLEAAERAAREGLLLAQQVGGAELGSSLTRLAVLLSYRGNYLQAFLLFRHAVTCAFEPNREHDVNLYAEFSHHALRTGQVEMAGDLAREAHELSLGKDLARPAIRVLNLQSATAEARGDLEAAIEHASSAMDSLRSMSYCSEEIRGLLSLARLHEKKGHVERARGFLEDLWPLVQRGPYPADRGRGLAILARLELRQGRDAEAGRAAYEAFELAGDAPFYNPRLMAEAGGTLERLGLTKPTPPVGLRPSPLPAVTVGRHTV